MSFIDSFGLLKLVRAPNAAYRLFGFNGDVDIAAAEDVWAGGGDYPFPAAAAATTVVSDSANDTAAGTGARTVRVIGLNALGAVISEDATLLGATPVALVSQFFRINGFQVLTAGSGGVNAGVVDVKHSATVIGRILAGQNIAQQAVFTVPGDVTQGYLANFSIGLLGGGTFLVRGAVLIREPSKVWRTMEILDVTNGLRSVAAQDPEFWLPLPPLTDVRVRCLSVGADNSVVTGTVDVYILK